VGIAPDNAQVAHRVGRTGRGGAKGRALMVLSQSEERVLKDLIEKEKMPITIRSTPATDLPSPPSVTEKGGKSKNKTDQLCKTFIATIGFYKAQVKRLGWKNNELVTHVLAMFEPLGVKTPAVCPVKAKLIGKMGLPAGHGLVVKK
jgi:superfamily II DNA/RNA helicase